MATEQNKAAADEQKSAADFAAAEAAEAKAAKEKADAEAAEAAEAEKNRLAGIQAETVAKAAETQPSDVTNAAENPNFSKAPTNNSDAEAPRVHQVGPSGQWGKSSQTPDAEIAAREQRLAAKEKELEAREAKLAKREDSQAKAEKGEGLEFEFEGKKYQFADDAPKSIRVGGKVLTQEEIAKDEEAALFLIGGGSSHIKKL